MTATQTRPPIDPRLRERRVAVIRARGRRRLRVLVALVAVGVVIGAAALAVFSPVLDVDHIEIRGAGGARADEVTAAAGIEEGDPILLLDPDGAVGALEALSWVDDARVERELPNTVRITVTRRVVVGWVAASGGDGTVALVDDEGRVLGTAATAPEDVPELTGVEQVPDVGARIEPASGAEILGQLPAELLARTASIRLAAGSAILVLDGGPEVRLGDATDVATKGRVALAVLDALTGPITYLDVQVPSVPVTG